MNKKLLTQAITLGLLVAAPYNVWAANNYGIKADEVAVNGNELFPNGVISDVKKGIYAKNKVDFTVADIKINAQEYGVYVTSGGDLNLGKDKVQINVNDPRNGKSAYAIHNDSNSSVKITANDVLLSVNSGYATALYNKSGNNGSNSDIRKADVDVNAKNKVTINVAGTESATGIRNLQELSKVDITAPQVSFDVHALNNTATGIKSELKGIVNINNADKIDIQVKADGANGKPDKKKGKANGILTDKDGVVNIQTKEFNLQVDGNALALGIDADNSANVNVTGDAVNIVAKSTEGATGINVANQGQVNVKAQDLAIQAEGNDARGVNVSTNGNVVLGTADSNIAIDVTGKKNAIGLATFEHGKSVVNGKNFVVNAVGDDSLGVHVQNNGTGEKKAQVDLNAENTVIKADNALGAYSEGKLNVNGNIYTEAKNALIVRGFSEVNINTENKNNLVQLNGNINFNVTNDGNSGLLADADVNIQLTNKDSYLNGNIIKTQDGKPDEHIDMHVDGMKLTLSNGGTWNSDKDSFVNDLILDGGIVSMNGSQQNITADNVTGNSGLVHTNDLNNQLHVDKIADNTEIVVQGNGAIADQIFQDKANADKLAGVVVGGADNAVLTDKVTTEEGVIGGAFEGTVDKDGHVVGGIQAQNTFNMGVSDMASVSLMAWRAENDDMNQRLGELRDSKGEHGIWTRMVKGESEYGAITNKYTKYELGYDEKLSTNEHWTVGAAISYTDGDSSFAKGSGENTHKGLSVYGSYLADDGSYVDLIAKYAKLEHEFDVLGGIGKGDYEANGYSVSAEYGKRFTKDNGFWVEPQVQLSYGKVGAVSYATANAIAEQDGMDSLVGRVGFRMGKDFAQGNVYAKASYLYDFDGETSVTMRKGSLADTYGQDLGGGWWEVGVGTNVALSDASYLYLDVERTYGGEVETPWQWNVGLRYSF